MSLETEMDEDAPEVFIIFFDPVIERADVLLIEKAQDFLFERAAPFAGDDLDQFNFLGDGFLNDAIQFHLDFVAFVINIVQIEL